MMTSDLLPWFIVSIVAVIVVIIIVIVIIAQQRKKNSNQSNNESVLFAPSAPPPVTKVNPQISKIRQLYQRPVKTIGIIESYDVDLKPSIERYNECILSCFIIGDDGSVLSPNKNILEELNTFTSDCKSNGVVPTIALGHVNYNSNNSLILTDTFYSASDGSVASKTLKDHDTWVKVFENEDIRLNLAHKIFDLCQSYGISGCCIDFESGTERDKQLFVNFVTYMAQKLAGIRLSVVLDGNIKTLETTTDVHALYSIPNVNFILICCDYVSVRPLVTTHHQSIEKIEETLNWLKVRFSSNFDGSRHAIMIGAFAKGFNVNTKSYLNAMQTQEPRNIPYEMTVNRQFQNIIEGKELIIAQKNVPKIPSVQEYAYVEQSGSWIFSKAGPSIWSVLSEKSIHDIMSIVTKFNISDICVWSANKDDEGRILSIVQKDQQNIGPNERSEDLLLKNLQIEPWKIVARRGKKPAGGSVASNEPMDTT